MTKQWTRKLSARQQSVLDRMREGWMLIPGDQGWYRLRREGRTLKVPPEIIAALVRAGRIVQNQDGSYRAIDLRDRWKSEVVSRSYAEERSLSEVRRNER